MSSLSAEFLINLQDGFCLNRFCSVFRNMGRVLAVKSAFHFKGVVRGKLVGSFPYDPWDLKK